MTIIRCGYGEGEVLQCCSAYDGTDGNYMNEVSILGVLLCFSRTSADAAGSTAKVGVGQHRHRRKARAPFADTPGFLQCKLSSRTLAHCLPSPSAPLLSAASYRIASVDTFPPALPWPALACPIRSTYFLVLLTITIAPNSTPDPPNRPRPRPRPPTPSLRF